MNKPKIKYPTGTTSEVAKRLGLSVCTVSDVLKNKRSSAKATEILQATAEYVTEVQIKEREAREALNAVLNATM